MDALVEVDELVTQCQQITREAIDVNLNIVREATAANLPILLVGAIVTVESNNDQWQIRAESRYPYLWHVGRREPYRSKREFPSDDWVGSVHSAETEWIGQRMSWGPMQIMGATARELGYEGPFPQLCDPAVGIRYGVDYLAKLRNLYFNPGGWEAVVAAYNSGSPRQRQSGEWVNQEYVDRVREAGGFEGLESS